jgi:hypothetical protein
VTGDPAQIEVAPLRETEQRTLEDGVAIPEHGARLVDSEASGRFLGG